MKNQKNSLKKIAQFIMIVLCITSLSSMVINAADDSKNRYLDQFVQNNQNPFLLYNSSNEQVNPFIGNLAITYTDLILKGKNGLDFKLIRNYNSAESGLFDLTRDSVIEDNPNEIFYDIGSGWSYDIPYIRELGYSSVHNHMLWEINYGVAGSDVITHFGDRSSKSGTTFKNNKNEDKQVYFAINEFSSGQHQSLILLEYQNGHKMYFTEEGMLIGQVDRYGNTIRYEYDTVILPSEEGNGLSLPRTRYRLERVVDTLGRVIQFQYTSSAVTVNVTDDGKTKQIVYGFTKVVDLTSLRPENLEGLVDYTDKVLTSVTNPLGQQTNYTYRFERGRKNYSAKSVEGQDNIYMYALLEQIAYPGGTKAKYEYIKSIKNLGLAGGVEFFKISKRYDEVILGDGSSRNENVIQYNYSFDQSNEYDGYPLYGFDLATFTYKDFPTDFKVRVSVVDSLGTSEYIADKELKIQQIIRTTNTTKTVEDRQYDSNDRVVRSIMKDYESTSSEVYQETVSHYDFDQFGRVAASWSPLTSVDSSYNRLNDEFKTTYTYDNQYGHLISKTYKQNQNMTIEEKNLLTADGKSIAAKEIYANSILKEKKSFTYDSYGNITNIKNYKDDFSSYVETQLNYTGSGRNAYPSSVVQKNVYDVDGNLIGDVTTTTEYDGFGNIIKVTDAENNITQYNFDVLDRQTKTIFPNGTTSSTIYTVLTNGFKTTQTNQQNNSFSIDYDSLGRLSKIVDNTTNKVMSSKVYNTDGRVSTSYDPRGNRTEYIYHPDGSVKEEKVYDVDNNILSHKKNTVSHAHEFQGEKYLYGVNEIVGSSPEDSYFTYTYMDKMGRLAKTGYKVDGVIYRQSYTYDYVGNAIEYKDHIKVAWKKEYDYANRVVKEINANNGFITFQYNALGQNILSKDYRANESTTDYNTTYKYDELGRLIEEKKPFEIKNDVINYQVRQNIYDKIGRLVEQRENNNQIGEALTWRKQYFTYDEASRLSYVQLTHNNQPAIYSQYYYDEIGNVLRKYTGLSSPLTINGLDNVSGSDTDYSITKFTYDHLGNQTKFVDPMGQEETFVYDQSGNMTSHVDRNKTTFTYTYDGLDRITEETATNSQSNLSYNKTNRFLLNGNMDFLTFNGETTDFFYDGSGRLTRSTTGNAIKYYSYDTFNNRTALDITIGGQSIIDVDYTYDNLNRMNEVKANGNIEGQYTYDANGNKKTVRYGNKDLGADYSYNLANVVKTITNVNTINANPESALPVFTYDYQLDGNIIKTQDNYRNVTLTYNYDDLNRLIQETKVNNGSIPQEQPTDSGDMAILANYSVDYTFDDYGNIKTKQNNGVTTSYTYDKNCRVMTETSTESNITTKKIYTYDPNGNQLSVTTESYSNPVTPIDKYSVVVTGVNGISTADITFNTYNLLNQLVKVYTGDKKIKYTYDYNGLRSKKIANDETTKFIYDGSNMIAELNSDDSVKATYLYGTSLILQKDSQNNKHYYFFNAHGDVVAITDDQGNVKNRYEYNAYGEDYAFGNGVRNPLKYFGQYFDEETSTYYLRARYYNPVLMRFITEDSYKGDASDPLSLNLYTYAHNNPIFYIDPSGYSVEYMSDGGSGLTKHDIYMQERVLNGEGFFIKLVRVVGLEAGAGPGAKVGGKLLGQEINLGLTADAGNIRFQDLNIKTSTKVTIEAALSLMDDKINIGYTKEAYRSTSSKIPYSTTTNRRTIWDGIFTDPNSEVSQLVGIVYNRQGGSSSDMKSNINKLSDTSVTLIGADLYVGFGGHIELTFDTARGAELVDYVMYYVNDYFTVDEYNVPTYNENSVRGRSRD